MRIKDLPEDIQKQLMKEFREENKRKGKYNNRKVTVDGITFDSQKECDHWFKLKARQKAHEIRNLNRQVTFELIPAQKEGNRVVERACTYKADFVYIDCKTGETVVEDVKGVKTEVYKIKKKLMRWVHGITIKEVYDD